MGRAGDLWAELRRRRMFRAAATYAVIAFAVLQVAEPVVHGLRLPDWVTTLLVIGCALGFPVTFVLAWIYDLTPRGIERTPAAPPGPAPAVAVLPFANRSASADDAYLGDALGDEIINALGRLERLRVVARTSSFAYRGEGHDVRRIGQELKAGAVLEGSVQREKDRLRVSTQLVGVSDGLQLWAGRFDAGMSDLFAIQDVIARKVAEALRVVLTERDARALTRPVPADPRAYEQCLRGRQFLQQTRKKSLLFAREMFERAIAIDPRYAPAHAGLSEAAALLEMYYPPDDAALDLADRASARAIELEPALAEAHAARGLALFLRKRYADSEAEFQRAIALDARLFEPRYYAGRAAFQQGRLEDAVRRFREATSVREDYQAAFFAAQACEALGRREEAQDAYAEALRVVEKHMDLNPDDPRAATMRAVSLCRLERREEGLRWAERALAIDPLDAGVRYNVACLYALEGESATALRCLEEVVGAGFRNREWIEKDPDLASLRGEPRFQQLLAAM